MNHYLQTHSETDCAPVPAVLVPVGHGLHSVKPSKSLYVPLAHCSHGDDVSFSPVDEKLPGLHCPEK